MALDIVDWAIVLVGLTMLPMLPDLLGNILIAFLPDSYVTASVRRWYAARSVISVGVGEFQSGGALSLGAGFSVFGGGLVGGRRRIRLREMIYTSSS